MKNKLDRIQIVLAEPQSSENIGAVCRAMKTMGITKLAIVGEKIYDITGIKNLSVHAFDIYERSLSYKDLKSAVSNSVLTAGATRRLGKRRKYFSVYPEELARKIDEIAEGEISIIFGRESSGLTDDELAKCNIVVNIPSSPNFPSLNLAQAVQVIAYSIYRSNSFGSGYKPVNSERMDRVIQTVTDSLGKIGFYKFNEKNEMEHFFSDIFMRAGVSQTESLRIEKIFRKIADIKIHKTE